MLSLAQTAEGQIPTRLWWDNPDISGSTTLRVIPELCWDLPAKLWVQLSPSVLIVVPLGGWIFAGLPLQQHQTRK